MPGLKHIILAVVLTPTCAVQSALGQVARLPEPVQKRLAEIGPVYQTDIRKYIPETQQLFTPLLAQGAKAGVTVTTDQQYGPDVKQRLDVYQPANAHDLPVVIFFHGGALTSGDKNINGEAYANVLYYFARNGFLGLNATYRLAPKFAYPAGAQDVGSAVKWTKTSVRRFGGDPERIFLIGHSSGATHAATWAFDSSLHGPGGPGVAGIVLLSGRLKADNRADDPNGKNVEAYFGTDTSLYAARSPVTFGAKSSLPTFIVIAEYDNPFLDTYGAELFDNMCKARGKCPRFLRLVGHNHISMVASFNTADDELGREIIDFVAKGR
jgi:acetyl esterase/lipase